MAEALTNATRHAGARSVRIQLSQASGLPRAQVTDDGCGGADPAHGTGLPGWNAGWPPLMASWR